MSYYSLLMNVILSIILKNTEFIYKNGKKIGPKNALFCPDFRSIFIQKPLHIVVKPSYLPFEPLFVIIIIVST